MAFHFIEQSELRVLVDGFERLLDDPAAVLLHCQSRHIALDCLGQRCLLFSRAVLEELLEEKRLKNEKGIKET